MKYKIECPVKNCSFQMEISLELLDSATAEAETIEATARLQSHLRSHGIEALVDTVFRSLMEDG